MIGTVHARLALLGGAAIALVAGCGGSGAKSTSAGTTGGARTSPAQPSGPVLEETRRPADPAAVRVIRGWTDAQRASNVDRATSYFALPALVENGTAPEQLPTRAAVRAFNAALPCGAVLLRTSAATQPGFTVATFRLVDRPGQRCDGTGNQARTAFGVRAGKIRAWVRIPDHPQGGGSQGPQPTSPQPGTGTGGQAA
jgi:hypothetical protein